MSLAKKYAEWVLAPENELETGRLIKQAARRFLNDLKRDDIYFDEKEAVRMPEFCEENLCQWEDAWAGVPLKFELWQRFIFEQIFGWIRKDTGTRRFTEVFVQVSKKQGKSTMAAGLMLDHLLADPKVNTPKVFTAANNEDQAKICVNMAGRMIEHSQESVSSMLDDDTIRLMRYKENITEVINEERNGFIKAFSKESGDKKLKTSGGKHGVNTSLGVVDEFGLSQDHGASGTIKTSMAARRERLMFYITTAGFNMDGPCYRELRKVGIQVLDGAIVKDNYLPIIYEIDPPKGEDGKDQPITIQRLVDNEAVWRQCAPNLEVSVSREFLREQLNDALTYGGTKEVEIKTLNFNMWVDSPEVFIQAEVWNKNTHGITEEDLLGQECYGGIEIVGAKYMNAFVFLFPNIKGVTVIKPVFWMPDDYRKSNESDQYSDWVKAGLIHTDLGNVFDNQKIFEILTHEIGKYYMHSFAYRNNMVNNDVVQLLIKAGYQSGNQSHGSQQITTPTLIWEELITSGKCEHFGNPILAWMNSNCMAVRKNNDIRLEKSGSKVVGIYAAINAISQWKTNEAEEIKVGTDFIAL